uniref:Uncharacterized protein n=1 Tax=Knipowitschia caucasica TaxID=637954 RepID=A0AAV2KWC8_KNICA
MFSRIRKRRNDRVLRLCAAGRASGQLRLQAAATNRERRVFEQRGRVVFAPEFEQLLCKHSLSHIHCPAQNVDCAFLVPHGIMGKPGQLIRGPGGQHDKDQR